MTLEQALLTKILAESSITSLVPPKGIYAGILPIQTKLPALMFVTQTIPEKERTIDGTSLPIAMVRFYCWSEEYSDSRNLCEAVRLVFERFSGTISGIKVLLVLAENEQDIYDDTGEGFGRSLDLIIKYVEPE